MALADKVNGAEEPDAVVPHVRFCEGRRGDLSTAEILWHPGLDTFTP